MPELFYRKKTRKPLLEVKAFQDYLVILNMNHLEK